MCLVWIMLHSSPVILCANGDNILSPGPVGVCECVSLPNHTLNICVYITASAVYYIDNKVRSFISALFLITFRLFSIVSVQECSSINRMFIVSPLACRSACCHFLLHYFLWRLALPQHCAATLFSSPLTFREINSSLRLRMKWTLLPLWLSSPFPLQRSRTHITLIRWLLWSAVCDNADDEFGLDASVGWDEEFGRTSEPGSKPLYGCIHIWFV